MKLAIQKCVILKSSADPTKYSIQGSPIREVNAYKSLAVGFDKQMKFRQHSIKVTVSSSRMYNPILRTFMLQSVVH